MGGSSAPLLVACLCAEWCGTCRDYRPPLRQLAQERAGEVEVAWIDIEDHDEVPGPLDIENFPTLLIARGEVVLFFGTVLPHAQTLSRLVQSALVGDLPPLVDADLDGLPGRVRAIPAELTRP